MTSSSLPNTIIIIHIITIIIVYLSVRLMVSGEERASPHSAEDQARLVFTDLVIVMIMMMIIITIITLMAMIMMMLLCAANHHLDLDLDRDLSSSSVDRNEALLKKHIIVIIVQNCSQSPPKL